MSINIGWKISINIVIKIELGYLNSHMLPYDEKKMLLISSISSLATILLIPPNFYYFIWGG